MGWLDNTRLRIGDTISGKVAEQRRFAEFDIMLRAYLDGPFVRTPDVVAAEFKEQGAGAIADLLYQLQDYELLLGYAEAPEVERIRAIDESRLSWRRDPLFQWIISLWTNYGLGTKLAVAPKDEEARKIWDKFWEDPANKAVLSAQKIHGHSERLLIDGEFFWVNYISKLDGSVKLRWFETKQITEIITHPDDELTVLFYKRQWTNQKTGVSNTLYYPDASTMIMAETEEGKADELFNAAKVPEDQRADKLQDNALVLCSQVARDIKNQKLPRGWPLMCAGVAWSRQHKAFRENRASLAMLMASLVAKIKHSGGSRVGDIIKGRFQSSMSQGSFPETNPTLGSGMAQVLTENKEATFDFLSHATGAGDAKEDGAALMQMAGLGGGVYPHYLGSGEAYRLATASAMEMPLLRNWGRYQAFWADEFRNVVARTVFWAAEKYGVPKPVFTLENPYEVDVVVDRLVEEDLPALARSIGILLQRGLEPYVGTLVPEDAARRIQVVVWRTILQALGATDAEKIASNESFGVESVGVSQPKPSPTVTLPLELFHSEDPAIQAMLSLDYVGDPLAETDDPEKLLIAVNKRQAFLEHAALHHKYGDIRSKAGEALRALDALEEKVKANVGA